MPSTSTTVATIPACDLCGSPAYADAAIPGSSWAYVCKTCFDSHGCHLGLGRGQELKLASADALDAKYDRWLAAVDKGIEHFIGAQMSDLEDWGCSYDYAAAYAEGLSPGVAAAKAIKAAAEAGF